MAQLWVVLNANMKYWALPAADDTSGNSDGFHAKFHIVVDVFAYLQVESRTRPVSQQHLGNSCPLESGNTIRLAENTIRLPSCRAFQMKVQ